MSAHFMRQPHAGNGLVKHDDAVLGAPLVLRATVSGVSVLEGTGLRGLEGAYYPEHCISLVRRPIRAVGGWLGERHQSEWEVGSVPLIPKDSCLSFRTNEGYDLTTVMVPENLFSSAADGVIDLSTIDFEFRDAASPSTAHLIDVMSRIAADPGMAGWPLLLESVATSLAVSILCSLSPYASREYAYKPYSLGPARRKRVIDYIEANFHRQITLAELAGVASLSLFHFTRMFKVYFGMTPLRYIAQKRVDAAKRMLVLSGEPLAHICYACGFASQSHFTTVFKKVTGTTPDAYRRMIN